jgi:hypothetical protein
LISTSAGDQAIILAKRCSVMPLKCLCLCFPVPAKHMDAMEEDGSSEEESESFADDLLDTNQDFGAKE